MVWKDGWCGYGSSSGWLVCLWWYGWCGRMVGVVVEVVVVGWCVCGGTGGVEGRLVW